MRGGLALFVAVSLATPVEGQGVGVDARLTLLTEIEGPDDVEIERRVCLAPGDYAALYWRSAVRVVPDRMTFRELVEYRRMQERGETPAERPTMDPGAFFYTGDDQTEWPVLLSTNYVRGLEAALPKLSAVEPGRSVGATFRSLRSLTGRSDEDPCFRVVARAGHVSIYRITLEVHPLLLPSRR